MKNIRKVTTFSMLLGAIAAIGCIAAFAINVGAASYFRVSSNASDWAAFGDYLGGVLGTIFSGLAFVAILLTLQLQQHQISQLKQQDKFKELQNTLSSYANSIDVALSRDISISYKGVKSEASLLKFLILLGGLGSILPHTQKEAELFEAVKSELGTDFSLLVRTIDNYASLIEFYRERGGDPDIAKVYMARFELQARMVRSAHPHMEIGLSDAAYRIFGLTN